MPANLPLKRSFSKPGPDPAEQELLEKVRSRNPRAMRLFYERYVGYLTAVCSRYVPDPASVKDILQDAFLRIFDSVGRFEYRGEGSVKAWVRRIVVNGALKHLQASGRLSYRDDLPEMADEPEDLPPLDVPPELVQRLIKELPDGYRTVFNLFVFEEKSHKEIAQLLGIKEDSSASQFFRARKLLARQIKAYLQEHEER